VGCNARSAQLWPKKLSSHEFLSSSFMKTAVFVNKTAVFVNKTDRLRCTHGGLVT
jgi:hypothetical protein